LNIYEGPGGSYYPSRPLAQLKPADHDLIVIAASDPAKDSRLADAVHALPGRPDGCVTLRYGAFRNAFLGALYGLQVKKYFTTLNLRKTAAVAASLFFSLAAPGCVIECGTYCGGTAIFLASMMRHLGTPRTVHAFDTFAGLPPAVAEDRGSIFQTGLFANASESFVSDCVKAHGLDGVVQLHKGLVQETIAELWKQENTVCLAFLDTDQYTGTLSSLANVLPRLHPNGFVVDDCFEPGVQRAVRETLAKVPEFNGAMISYNVHLLWRRTRSEAQSPRS
jgi:predicted O-methyltransferase YrrM